MQYLSLKQHNNNNANSSTILSIDPKSEIRKIWFGQTLTQHSIKTLTTPINIINIFYFFTYAL